MAINEMKALSLAEAKELAGDKEINDFLKKFIKLDVKKSVSLREELENLGLLKIKAENISKVIDLLPEDSTDLNKIFIDVGLDEDEINKILGVIKKYK